MELEDVFYCAHNAVRSAQTGSTTSVPKDFHPVRDGGAYSRTASFAHMDDLARSQVGGDRPEYLSVSAWICGKDRLLPDVSITQHGTVAAQVAAWWCGP